MEHITREIWQRVKEVANGALDLDAAARAAFVDRTCAEDTALRAEVLSLLASIDAAAPLFETPGGAAGATLYSNGSRIGPYRIVRELASGGMGSVYLAERDDGEFRQRVAIKIVRGGFANAFLLQRFREERRILASLEHPNIARLLDGGTTETGLAYVVMEFVEGEPIDRFCAAKRLSLHERLVLFQHVCAAVQYAHDHLVIHRDIKAANILVASDGVPKLLDFGIAKVLNPDTGLETGGYTTIRVMTPESASPEQLTGKPITVAADVYALGVLMYRLLTSQSPYGGPMSGDADLIRAVCEKAVDRPSARPPALSERIPFDVDMIVMKALRKEPERRYGSPERLADDIQRYLDGRPVLASPDSVRYRAGKFIGRHRVAVFAACAVAVSVVGGVAMTIREARIAERERVKAEREFNAVRGFAQSMLGEMHTAVSRLPGSTAAREILLRRATEYLDALSPEAQEDDALRREVARGYGSLADVQGTVGLANIGNRDAARVSLAKAAALLEPLADPRRGLLTDRLYLARVLATLVESDPGGRAAGPRLDRARTILESLTPAEQSTIAAIEARRKVWTAVANRHIDARDYAAALVPQQRALEAGTAAVAARPDDLSENRNLSLAYKQLGALLEVLNRRPEAIPFYEKALALDQGRVNKQPAQPMWQLDLSFSQASLAGIFVAQGDLERGRSWYEQAVALREHVLAIDPENDFAKTSLARGYDRLATVRGTQGDVPAAFDYTRRRIDVFRRRLEAHPDREYLWSEYTAALLDAAEKLDAALAQARTTVSIRRQYVPQATALLDQIVATEQRWTAAKHTSPLPPTADAIQQERARLEKLTADAAAR
jgi:non-specific serine/threonine protein kinase/serine/threonine-protein kinase